MKAKEAIKLLEKAKLVRQGRPVCTKELLEAFDMAIEALKREKEFDEEFDRVLKESEGERK